MNRGRALSLGSALLPEVDAKVTFARDEPTEWAVPTPKDWLRNSGDVRSNAELVWQAWEEGAPVFFKYARLPTSGTEPVLHASDLGASIPGGEQDADLWTALVETGQFLSLFEGLRRSLDALVKDLGQSAHVAYFPRVLKQGATSLLPGIWQEEADTAVGADILEHLLWEHMDIEPVVLTYIREKDLSGPLMSLFSIAQKLCGDCDIRVNLTEYDDMSTIRLVKVEVLSGLRGREALRREDEIFDRLVEVVDYDLANRFMIVVA